MSDLPEMVAKNLTEVVQGRYYQKDGSWFEKAGEGSFTKHKVCHCGAEMTLVGHGWDHSCSEEMS